MSYILYQHLRSRQQETDTDLYMPKKTSAINVPHKKLEICLKKIMMSKLRMSKAHDKKRAEEGVTVML